MLQVSGVLTCLTMVYISKGRGSINCLKALGGSNAILKFFNDMKIFWAHTSPIYLDAFSRFSFFLCSPFTDHEFSLTVDAWGLRAFLREWPSLISIMVFHVILRYCLPMSVQPISAVKMTRPITQHFLLKMFMDSDVNGPLLTHY